MPLISSFSTTPIPNLSLSAGGLLALADLTTIAQRTALTGGSSWLDALVLAPGLHYQQAADALARSFPDPTAIELVAQGETRRHVVTNPATVNYLRRVFLASQADLVTGRTPSGRVIVLDVGMMSPGRARGLMRRRRRLSRSGGREGRRAFEEEEFGDFEWGSHALYLASPVLTVAAIVLVVLLEDWWGLGFILALMVSRILNIWIIKQRTKPFPLPIPSPDPQPHRRYSHQSANSPPAGITTTAATGRLTEYYIDLSPTTSVRLRGMASDLQAITTDRWLRTKTYIQGYLEATAKLIVYLVAAFSGNLTQAGAIVLMTLLGLSAGLLALSNAHVKRFRMHGRVALPSTPPASEDGGGQGDGSAGWTSSSVVTSGVDDWAEKGQIGNVVRDPYPFEDNVDYN